MESSEVMRRDEIGRAAGTFLKVEERGEKTAKSIDLPYRMAASPTGHGGSWNGMRYSTGGGVSMEREKYSVFLQN